MKTIGRKTAKKEIFSGVSPESKQGKVGGVARNPTRPAVLPAPLHDPNPSPLTPRTGPAGCQWAHCPRTPSLPGSAVSGISSIAGSCGHPGSRKRRVWTRGGRWLPGFAMTRRPMTLSATGGAASGSPASALSRPSVSAWAVAVRCQCWHAGLGGIDGIPETWEAATGKSPMKKYFSVCHLEASREGWGGVVPFPSPVGGAIRGSLLPLPSSPFVRTSSSCAVTAPVPFVASAERPRVHLSSRRVRPHRSHCPQVRAIRSRRGIGAGLAGLA